MKKTRLLSIAVFAAALAGCALSPAEEAQRGKLVDAQIKESARPTFEMTCPADGCKIGGMAYTDPRDRGHIKMPTTGADVAVKFIDKFGDVVQSAVLPVVGAHVLKTGFEAVRDAKGATTSVTNNASGGSAAGGGNSTNTTTSNTASAGSVAGQGSASADSHAVDSHNTDSSVHDSHNADNHQAIDNSVTTTP